MKTSKKNVYIILCFHAHELLWDLPEMFLADLDAENPMKSAILPTNYVEQRKREGRDIYSGLVEFSERLGIPCCLECTNELLYQIANVLPKTYFTLKKAFFKERLYPVYGHAHHTHVSLLTQDELTIEIKWNMEYLHNVMGIPLPKYRGVFPTEASIDFDKIEGISDANMDYIISPHFSREKIDVKKVKRGNLKYFPSLVDAKGKKVLIFPRNFPFSQEIWRPITKMHSPQLKWQGYCLGKFNVFYDEYRNGHSVQFPIEYEDAVREYSSIIADEIENAPDNGVLLYVQDLELMDFGDIALKLLEDALRKLLRKPPCKINFVTPDTYIDNVVAQKVESLPVIEFEKICWVPEIRLVLRVDGHYPPLGVGVWKDFNMATEVYQKRPFIFWENGKFLIHIFEQLINLFNITYVNSVNADKLVEMKYDFSNELPETKVILYLRFMKRADNWGWRPTEGRQKRPYLNGYLIAKELLKVCERKPKELLFNKRFLRFDIMDIAGVRETFALFVEKRLEFLFYGLNKLEKERKVDVRYAYQEVNSVKQWEKRAFEAIDNFYNLNKGLLQKNISKKKRFEIIIDMLKQIQEHCLAAFMSFDSIQRVWGKVDSEYLVERMYEYLYGIYPPLMPSLLDKIESIHTTRQADRYFSKQAEQQKPAKNEK